MSKHSTIILNFKHLPHRQAFMLAWPMILANISIPVMGLADSAMLAHLDKPDYVGAVAIGANILAFLYWAFSFLRMGTTSQTGQALGAQKNDQVAQELKTNLLLALLISGALILFQFVIIPVALQLMAPSENIYALSESYITIRIWGAPAVLATYVVIGWFIGLQNTKVPLVITVSANILNIIFDYLFIVVFDWQVRGAALASVIAEYSGLFIGLFFAIKVSYQFEDSFFSRFANSVFGHLKKIASLNFDLFLRTASLLFVFNFFTAQSGRLGVDVLAANALIMQFALFISFFLDGYAHAAEAMVSKAIGSGNVAELHRSSFATISVSAFIALFLAVFLWLFGGFFLSLLTDLPSVLALTLEFHTWLILLPLISIWCYIFDGIFIGAGQTRLLRNWMLIGVFLIFLPLWKLLTPLASHGLWLAFICFNGFRGVTLAVAYVKLSRNKKWLQ